MRIDELLQKILLSLLFVTLLGMTPVILKAASFQQGEASSRLVTMADIQEMFYKADIENMIRVEIEDEPLENALSKVASEVGLRLTYRGDIMSDKMVTMARENISVSNALDYILIDTGLDYSISQEGYLLISEAVAAEAEFQEVVRGTVTDATTNESLPGVNVIVKGTNTGTATGLNGEFELTVPTLNDTLVFSYISYQTQEVPLDGQSELNISMQQIAISGDEIIVVGYGQQRRRDITGSIASISAEDIANEPSQQIAQSLQGRVSGVQIMQDSGNPGSSFMMRIRGVGSVNDRSSAPLYVVDGNPMTDPSDISPSTIENIQILKSASAAAIYGARGANGVVLITTKQGRPGDTQMDVNFYEGIQYARRMPMVNATQYATLYNEAVTTAGQAPIFSDPNSFGTGTNWQDELYRPASIRDLQLSVSGGNERSTYVLSGSYFIQEGVVRTTEYDRLSLRLNSSHEINQFLRLGQNLSLSRAEYSQINPYGMGGTINNALGLDPTVPVRNADGSWGVLPRGGNLAASLQRQYGGTERPVLNGDVHAIVTPMENLTFRTQYNMAYGTNRSSNFNPEYFIAPTDQNTTSSISRSFNSWNNWNWENTLSYLHEVGYHSFDGMVGFTAQENTSESFNGSAQNLPRNADIFPGLRYLGMADSGQNVGGSGTAFGMVSYLGRINYNYDETYLATINYRVDGSSRFGENNRYGYFPSFSVGWRLSNEAFMSDIGFVNDLMVRGGWGALGNQESLSNYAFTSSVSTGLNYYFGENKTLFQGQAPTGMGNPNLRWESLRETNVGLDFTGFNNRINVTMDYYNRTTSDMLIQVPMIASSGIQDPAFSNAGEVVNRGLEFAIGYQQTTSGDFYYSLNANMSYNHNEVTALADGTSEILGGWISFVGENYTTRAVVGQPLGVFYGYKSDGIFQNQAEVDAHATQPNAAPGDLRFQDLNGDGVINSEDQTYIGNPWPSHTFGFSADFAYRNFDMNIGIQGVYGNDIFAAWKWYYYGPNWFNYHEDALGRWTGEGTSNTMPRLNINDPNSNLRNSDWYVEDGSYIRLNNVQIGYTIPQSVVNIRRLRVYATATNLITITGYAGVDPELGTSDSVAFGAPLFVGIDSGHYPVPRTFTFGINVGL